jgi:hypothetical protein
LVFFHGQKDPFLYITGKMGAAETAPGMPMVYDRRFVAAGTYRDTG